MSVTQHLFPHLLQDTLKRFRSCSSIDLMWCGHISLLRNRKFYIISSFNALKVSFVVSFFSFRNYQRLHKLLSGTIRGLTNFFPELSEATSKICFRTLGLRLLPVLIFNITSMPSIFTTEACKKSKVQLISYWVASHWGWCITTCWLALIFGICKMHHNIVGLINHLGYYVA